MKRLKSAAVVALAATALVTVASTTGKATQQNNEDDVIVAVVDSGYDGTNDRTIEGYSFVADSTDTTDKYGHGTSVTELILSNTPDTVQVMPVQVVGEDGSTDIETLYDGIAYAYENGADIINVSVNTVFYSDDMFFRTRL